ncbi:MAG TPA: cache domain-containing protein, partial [Streptomyces sp.]|nr:cache domain-containing protein [Streptomyces sp.]
MGSSPRPGPGPAAGGTHVLDGNASASADVAAVVRDTLECVFDAVAETRTDTAALLTSLSPEGRRATTADLAALRRGLHARLSKPGLISGAGFVAAPGLLADAPAWLEWWQRGPGGDVRPLLLDLDPEHSAYSDYTHWEWFALARDTGQRAVAGPYVDYLCSDEYSLTLSVPVYVGERFAGVAAADVYLPDFEAAVMPVLQ